MVGGAGGVGRADSPTVLSSFPALPRGNVPATLRVGWLNSYQCCGRGASELRTHAPAWVRGIDHTFH